MKIVREDEDEDEDEDDDVYEQQIKFQEQIGPSRKTFSNYKKIWVFKGI
jgi:hypothetical protein